jgi:hypothetical protein
VFLLARWEKSRSFLAASGLAEAIGAGEAGEAGAHDGDAGGGDHPDLPHLPVARGTKRAPLALGREHPRETPPDSRIGLNTPTSRGGFPSPRERAWLCLDLDSTPLATDSTCSHYGLKRPSGSLHFETS